MLVILLKISRLQFAACLGLVLLRFILHHSTFLNVWLYASIIHPLLAPQKEHNYSYCHCPNYS